MLRRLIFICFSLAAIWNANAATRLATSATRGGNSTAAAIRSVNGMTNAGSAAGYTYNYMYPYLNNQMRTDLNPGVTPTQSGNPIDVITRTEKLSSERRVVPRRTSSKSTAARSSVSQTPAMSSRYASGTSGVGSSAARSATPGTGAAPMARSAGASSAASTRRVVARRGVGTGARTTSAATARDNKALTWTAPASTAVSVTTDRCLADYMQCMDGYCQREDTEYNRCYCSARLAQIDAEYQPAIDSLVRQLLTLKSDNRWTDDEMNQYWMETVGKYTGTNAWVNIDNALDINWSDLESRVRGQNAFNTGHEYCVQHLRNCAASASNLRDAYRSEIARDCNAYETSLMRLKTAAESIIGSYSE